MKGRIIDILKGTTVDGPGFRTSIYFAGCRHMCKGCHNPGSWSFDAGRDYTVTELMDIIIEEDFDVTLSGGDPLYQPGFVSVLSARIKESGHTIWLYTGFTWEEICRTPRLSRSLINIDVVVDSPFIENLRDPDLLFRGSANQRIIDVKKSMLSSAPVMWTRN